LKSFTKRKERTNQVKKAAVHQRRRNLKAKQVQKKIRRIEKRVKNQMMRITLKLLTEKRRRKREVNRRQMRTTQ
jgi:hypothetical protein